MKELPTPLPEESDSEWRNLRSQFMAAVSNNASAAQRWAIFANHPWHQQELQHCAQIVVPRDPRLKPWVHDIAQEAMLLLARKLERTPDLRFDATWGAASFPGWLGTITLNNCRAAARRLRRHFHAPIEREQDSLWEDDQAERERWLDVQAALESLPEPDRTAIELYLHGDTAAETAVVLHCSQRTSFRILRRVLRTLQKKLADDDSSGGAL